MFLFTSNFKQYQYVLRLLLLVVSLFIVCSAINTVIYLIRRANNESMPIDQLHNDFYGRKCQHNIYSVLVYGDSRTRECVDPAILSHNLSRSCFNLGLSSGGMNNFMMALLDKRLDKTEGKAVIILGVTPLTLTEEGRKNDCYLNFNEKLRVNGNSMFINPEGPSVFDIITMPFQKVLNIGFINNGKIYKGENVSTIFHDNGWTETTITGDTKKAFRKTLELYREKQFVNNPISQSSIDEMLKWIRKWTSEGVTVVAFRPSTSPAMEELEEKKTAFSSLQIDKKIQEAGGIWWDCSAIEYVSFDGSHLDGATAKKFSYALAKLILENEKK